MESVAASLADVTLALADIRVYPLDTKINAVTVEAVLPDDPPRIEDRIKGTLSDQPLMDKYRANLRGKY